LLSFDLAIRKTSVMNDWKDESNFYAIPIYHNVRSIHGNEPFAVDGLLWFDLAIPKTSVLNDWWDERKYYPNPNDNNYGPIHRKPTIGSPIFMYFTGIARLHGFDLAIPDTSTWNGSFGHNEIPEYQTHR